MMLSISHYTWGPGGPGRPEGPVGPLGPFSPEAPGAPGDPFIPAGPCMKNTHVTQEKRKWSDSIYLGLWNFKIKREYIYMLDCSFVRFFVVCMSKIWTGKISFKRWTYIFSRRSVWTLRSDGTRWARWPIQPIQTIPSWFSRWSLSN